VEAGGRMVFYRDTFIEIDLDAVYENVMNLKKYFYRDLKVMAVVKADSYGHGAVMVAKTLLEANVSHFAVATLDEALELRYNGIKEPILIFGAVGIKYLDIVIKYQLTVSVNSLTWLKKALDFVKDGTVDFHLKIDSGMHRYGFIDETEIQIAIGLAKESDHFQLTGIYTHLATSEESNEDYYKMQVDFFETIISHLDIKGLLIHIANSAGSIKTPPPLVNMVRIGLFLNGICPTPKIMLPFALVPSLSLFSIISQIKMLPAHSKISYNGTFETNKETLIGTIPIGYADGYDRRMKNGRVWIAGQYAKVIGRICMDTIMVELTEWVEEGTRVELIGPHISIDEYSNQIFTNNYHATCAFTDRVPRIYRRNGTIVQIVNRKLTAQI